MTGCTTCTTQSGCGGCPVANLRAKSMAAGVDWSRIQRPDASVVPTTGGSKSLGIVGQSAVPSTVPVQTNPVTTVGSNVRASSIVSTTQMAHASQSMVDRIPVAKPLDLAMQASPTETRATPVRPQVSPVKAIEVRLEAPTPTSPPPAPVAREVVAAQPVETKPAAITETKQEKSAPAQMSPASEKATPSSSNTSLFDTPAASSWGNTTQAPLTANSQPQTERTRTPESPISVSQDQATTWASAPNSAASTSFQTAQQTEKPSALTASYTPTSTAPTSSWSASVPVGQVANIWASPAETTPNQTSQQKEAQTITYQSTWQEAAATSAFTATTSSPVSTTSYTGTTESPTLKNEFKVQEPHTTTWTAAKTWNETTTTGTEKAVTPEPIYLIKSASENTSITTPAQTETITAGHLRETIPQPKSAYTPRDLNRSKTPGARGTTHRKTGTATTAAREPERVMQMAYKAPVKTAPVTAQSKVVATSKQAAPVVQAKDMAAVAPIVHPEPRINQPVRVTHAPVQQKTVQSAAAQPTPALKTSAPSLTNKLIAARDLLRNTLIAKRQLENNIRRRDQQQLQQIDIEQNISAQRTRKLQTKSSPLREHAIEKILVLRRKLGLLSEQDEIAYRGFIADLSLETLEQMIYELELQHEDFDSQNLTFNPRAYENSYQLSTTSE